MGKKSTKYKSMQESLGQLHGSDCFTTMDCKISATISSIVAWFYYVMNIVKFLTLNSLKGYWELVEVF